MNDEQAVPVDTKLMPHNREAETQLLHAFMNFANAYEVTAHLLSPESFYVPEHQYIYEAMQQVYASRKVVDLVTVAEQLKNNGQLDRVGGATALVSIRGNLYDPSKYEVYARILQESHIKRKVIFQGHDLIRRAYDDTQDALDLMDKFGEASTSILGIATKNYTVSVADAANDIMAQVELAANQPDAIVQPVWTGIKTLDEVIDGIHPTDFILLAADSGMGKTSFALQVAATAASDDVGVAVVSLESNAGQVVGSMMCYEGVVNKRKLRNLNRLTELDREKLREARARMQGWPLEIVDTTDITPMILKAQIRRIRLKFLQAGKKLGLVVVDYLQLMEGDTRSHNREREVAAMSRSLKALALELEVPVIALSQINNNNKKTKDKRPSGADDIRESSAPYHDADMVLFLYRPEYYGIKKDKSGNDLTNVCEAIPAKHRHAKPVPVPLYFASWCGAFADIDVRDLPTSPIFEDNQLEATSSPAPQQNEQDDDLPF